MNNEIKNLLEWIVKNSQVSPSEKLFYTNYERKYKLITRDLVVAIIDIYGLDKQDVSNHIDEIANEIKKERVEKL